MADVINWQSILPNDGSEVANYCLRNLQKLWSHKITPAEFDKESNYAYVGFQSVLQEMKLKPNPKAPAAYEEMCDRRSRDKDKFDSAAFAKDHPEIGDYVKRLSAIVQSNRANALRLEDLYQYFSNLGDVQSATKVRAIYADYPLSIFNGSACLWKKRAL